MCDKIWNGIVLNLVHMIDIGILDISIFFLAISLVLIILFLVRKNVNLKHKLQNNQDLLYAKTSMETSFKMIANEILLKNHQNFLNIAKETFDKVLHVEKQNSTRKKIIFLT